MQLLMHEELEKKSPEELFQIIVLLQEYLQKTVTQKYQGCQTISELKRGIADLNQAQKIILQEKESTLQEKAKCLEEIDRRRQRVNALLQER